MQTSATRPPSSSAVDLSSDVGYKFNSQALQLESMTLHQTLTLTLSYPQEHTPDLNTTPTMSKSTGSCLCGKVTYEIEGGPLNKVRSAPSLLPSLTDLSRRSATATSAKRIVAASTAPTSSSPTISSSLPARQNPTPPKPSPAASSPSSSARSVDPRCGARAIWRLMLRWSGREHSMRRVRERMPCRWLRCTRRIARSG